MPKIIYMQCNAGKLTMQEIIDEINLGYAAIEVTFDDSAVGFTAPDVQEALRISSSRITNVNQPGQYMEAANGAITYKSDQSYAGIFAKSNGGGGSGIGIMTVAGGDSTFRHYTAGDVEFIPIRFNSTDGAITMHLATHFDVEPTGISGAAIAFDDTGVGYIANTVQKALESSSDRLNTKGPDAGEVQIVSSAFEHRSGVDTLYNFSSQRGQGVNLGAGWQIEQGASLRNTFKCINASSLGGVISDSWQADADGTFRVLANAEFVGSTSGIKSADVDYDNATSGLTATNTKDAIDELTANQIFISQYEFSGVNNVALSAGDDAYNPAGSATVIAPAGGATYEVTVNSLSTNQQGLTTMTNQVTVGALTYEFVGRVESAGDTVPFTFVKTIVVAGGQPLTVALHIKKSTSTQIGEIRTSNITIERKL